MAVLTASLVAKDPFFLNQFADAARGDSTQLSVEVWLVTEATGIAQTDEWIVTGLSDVKAVIGTALTGTTAQNLNPAFIMNAAGTAETDGDTPGALAIESTAAITASTIYVTVVGVP